MDNLFLNSLHILILYCIIFKFYSSICTTWLWILLRQYFYIWKIYYFLFKEVHIKIYSLLWKHEYFGMLCVYVSKWTHAFIRIKIVLKQMGDKVFIVCCVIKGCYKPCRSIDFWTASRVKTIEGADLLIWIFGPVVCSHTCF